MTKFSPVHVSYDPIFIDNDGKAFEVLMMDICLDG